MGKCKWCNESKDIKTQGYCENCYDTMRKSISDLKGELETLERRAKLDLPTEEKQKIIDRAIEYRNQLKVFKDKGVPFFKSSINEQCDNIFAKMGVEYRFPPEPVVMTPKKKNTLTIIGFILCFFIIGSYTSAYIHLNTEYEATQKLVIDSLALVTAKTEQILDLQDQLAALQQPEETTVKRTLNLENGNFISGQHFTSGIYNITAVSGNGVVSSDNLFDGGINAMMGTDTKDGFFQKQYKNISLPEGTTLTISNVKVKLTLGIPENFV